MPMTVKTLSRALAASLLLLAIVPGYYAVTLPWAPREDFDVVGVLYLLQNLPRLVAWFLTLAFGLGGIGLWVFGLRALTVRRRR